VNQERIYKVVLGPVISEKSSMAAELANQYTFRVARDANKLEIRKAVEQLFEVKVADVRTLVVKGKTKRTMRGMGRRSDWKKAYVTLAEGHEIEFGEAE
jgi:large subunit ribosomal protein L23